MASPSSKLNRSDPLKGRGFKCGLLSAKGGLMMGTKKGGGSLQPAKKSHYHYNKKNVDVKKKKQKK
jgi:hypothetical protein